MKKCFTCNIRYPLFMFSKNRMKYAREHDKGRVKVCRICCYKDWSSSKKMAAYNLETSKFEMVYFKSKLEILRRVLR
jgi:hypothetical protein